MSSEETRQRLRKEIAARVFKKKSASFTFISKTGVEIPWGFDFRTILLEPQWLNAYAELFWERYKDQYPFQVGGSETAGIPLVAAIVMKSQERGSPVTGFFVRKSRKKDSTLNAIEGTLSDAPIILVDDLINSGQTLHKAILQLERADRKITDIFTLLAFRPLDAYRFVFDRNIRIKSIFSLEDFGLPLESARTPEIPTQSFKVLWRFKSEYPSYQYVFEKSAPIIDTERVYFGSDQGILWALNQADGTVSWQYRVGLHPKGKGIFSTPALAHGVLYFGAYDGNVYAIDAKTGKKKWVFIEADWVGSSPAVATDLGILFIGLEFGLFKKHGGIVALDAATGEKRWEYTMSEYVHSSPLYIPQEKLVVIGCNDNSVYCFEAKTGKLRWKKETGGPIKSSFAYDPKHRLIICGSFDGHVYALDSRDGSETWKYKTGAGIFSTPLIHDGVVYVSSLDKNLYALDLTTGASRWAYSTAGRIFSSPVFAAGSIWIGSNDGRVYELNPTTGALCSFFQATERIVNAIAYNTHTDSLFVPTQANELFCLRKNLL